MISFSTIWEEIKEREALKIPYYCSLWSAISTHNYIPWIQLILRRALQGWSKQYVCSCTIMNKKEIIVPTEETDKKTYKNFDLDILGMIQV